MTSRRKFLQVGAVSAVATQVNQGHAEETPKTVALPASIAALKSMKEQARPILPEERRARQEKAKRLMEANVRDGASSAGHSVLRLSGLRRGTGARTDSNRSPGRAGRRPHLARG